jgi:hypothetical protein
MEEYLGQTDIAGVSADLCHLDSAVSTSWRLYKTNTTSFREVWFCNWEKKQVLFRLDVAGEEPVAYSERANRFFVHGGGWGIGDFEERIPQLSERGLNLDVIVNGPSDIATRRSNARYFMMDPEWNAWETDENGLHQFPPFCEVPENHHLDFKNNDRFPDAYRIIKYSNAIISKPGAGTLIDSVSSATPIVLLEPYGDYERKNGFLWDYLGFGIPFEKWVNTGCSMEILETLHVNLLAARSQVQDYVEEYISCNLRRP